MALGEVAVKRGWRSALAAKLSSFWPRRSAASSVTSGGAPTVAQTGSQTPDAAAVDHIALRQEIWGAGFLYPGRADAVFSLINPFGVDSTMSLSDLTAGLGGPSRIVAEQFDVYITGFERSAELARRGHVLSVAVGLGKKMPISVYDPEQIRLRAKAFDGVYGQFLTWHVADKQRLLNEIRHSLKPTGHFAFTDYVFESDAPDEAEVGRLARLESYPIRPSSLEELSLIMRRAGLNCRVSEDITESFRQTVLIGWQAYLKTAWLKGRPPRETEAIIAEAEAWVERLRALQAGTIRLYRFYATVARS